MKPLKMLGLAALAALMAMAFIDASSAMAEGTALCTADGGTCTEVTHVHETSVGNAVLLSSVGNVECSALFLGDSLGEGAPLVVKGHFTYSGCKLGSTSCTATEKSTEAVIEVERTAAEEASVKGSAEVEVKCGSIIQCKYNGSGLKGTGKGPLTASQTNGEVALSEQTVNHTGGLFCPSTGKLDITTTPLSATYIENGQLVTAETPFAEEEGDPLTGTNKNPFNLQAKIIRITRLPGTGAIVGGTCVVNQVYASLATCTVIQHTPVGNTVTWMPL